MSRLSTEISIKDYHCNLENIIKEYAGYNKYNLTIEKIKTAVVIDREKLKEPFFWRNNVVNAWAVSRTSGTKNDYKFGAEDCFVILIYDHKDKIKLSITSYGGMCSYKFNKFFDRKSIENYADLELHRELLSVVNELLDKKIIKIDGIEVSK